MKMPIQKFLLQKNENLGNILGVTKYSTFEWFEKDA